MRPSELQRHSAHTTWQKKEEMKKKKQQQNKEPMMQTRVEVESGPAPKKNEDHISISVNAAHKM